MTIKPVPKDKGHRPGKLADAELHPDERNDALEGMKLIGFAVWERCSGAWPDVTFPNAGIL